MGNVLSFWLGACLGSFVNVLAFRLPRDESVVFPGSRCPHCGAVIAFYDNLPILSWLWLRGRGRCCRRQISPRYLLVEVCAAALSLGIWQRWQLVPLWGALVIVAAMDLLAIALIDWDTGFIPDVLSFSLIIGGLAAAPFNPLWGGSRWHGTLSSLGGAGIGFLMCWVVAQTGRLIFKKEAMGGGDIILLAGVGAWLGGTGAFDALILGSLLGAVYGVGRVVRGSLRMADPVPFGPFLAAGAIFGFFILLPLGFPFIR